MVPLEELEAIRQRLAQYDETREAVIKVRICHRLSSPAIACLRCIRKAAISSFPHNSSLPPLTRPTPDRQACRDVQKNSKNAVYSVHRGDLDKAQALLHAAK